MKERIVLIPADYENAKQIAHEINNKSYRDAIDLHTNLSKSLQATEDDETPSEPVIYTIDNFILSINDDTIGLDGYFVAKILFTH